ncbi:MAG: pantetheine-phosphate adenylyltransferase [Candidatus Amulumruptor caecigallinarius]|nr:pantetheine-phosphate adenylyltransferase [Candidatus Amulumruptor caecigallinarius]
MTHKSDTGTAEPVVVFPGSFNPFTIGHKSIVDRCLAFGAKVVIGIGYNRDKASSDDIMGRLERIRSVFSGDSRVRVESYSGLTVDFVKQMRGNFMVRGVRSVADFEYERNLADANYDLAGIETMLMPALPQYSFISSSMVRELMANGTDTKKYLP